MKIHFRKNAIISFIVVIGILSIFSGECYARFIASASGSDQARVANWVVCATPAEGSSDSLTLSSTTTSTTTPASFSFTVQNYISDTVVSEVAVSYQVVVTLSGIDSDAVSLELYEVKQTEVTQADDSTSQINMTTSSDSAKGTTIFTSDLFNFDAGTRATDNYMLTVSPAPGKELSGDTNPNLKVEINATQSSGGETS